MIHHSMLDTRVPRTRAAVRTGTVELSGYAGLAARYPDEVGLVDEWGPLTFAQLHRRTNALAHALADRGVAAGDVVGMMCRNHRGFVETTSAAAELGADVLALDPTYSAAQVESALKATDPVAVVHDQEFAELFGGVDVELRLLGWHVGSADSAPTLEQLIADGSEGDVAVPRRQSRTIVLSSGTTGTPTAVPRVPMHLDDATSVLDMVPLRHRWTTHIAAPLSNGWGWAHLQLGLLLGSTLVLRRHFDPFDCVETVSIQGCDALVVDPELMRRIVALPTEVKLAFGLDPVKVVASSGAPMEIGLALAWMDVFGDTLFNVYGSAECPWITVATPADLRVAPDTVGRPPLGAVVRVYDDHGAPAPTGQPGRIFVSSPLLAAQDHRASGTEEVDGLVAAGDSGRFDAAGRLFVDGRDEQLVPG